MTKLSNGTWVVVADSEKVLVLENITDAQDPNLNVLRKREEENPPDRDQKANRTGRMNDGGPGQKSAVDDTDFHELQKERFATDLAERLYDDAHSGKFERLILVAAPQVLGVLRGEMHTEVSSKVVAEIDKNLTNHPLDEIEKIVSEALAQDS